MKRVIGLVFGFGAASCIATGAIAADHASHTKPAIVAKQESEADLAPADEYFGILKLSILGINNTIRDLGLRYDVNHDIASQTFESAQETEQAIHDWEHKYPHDRLIPRSVYFLQRLYTKILSADSRSRATRTANWLFGDFRSSAQAKQLHKILAVEHLAPLPPPTPSPAATRQYPSVFGPGYPSQFAPTATPAHS
ncbi:MAG: hypothetical protein ACLPYS_02085 [Vulcanimicrobiaceae bacterium]